MEVRLAKSFGFCFGVKRAIKIAEKSQDGITLGELIHNQKEIDRLKQGYGVRLEKGLTRFHQKIMSLSERMGFQKMNLQN